MIDNLYIFKTNIDKTKSLNRIKNDLNSNHNINSWYLDQEDKDNILKIQTNESVSEKEILKILESSGFQFDPLTD